jgi:dihydrofolate synthase/folylpolyglutamate synthase
MDYQQTLDYIYSFLDSSQRTPRPPPELNIPRTRALLALLGEPQDAFRSVVVAGTKGKGSTCAMLEAILRAAGYRTGLWTSPHLHSYRERIQVNRTPIGQGALVALVARARPLFDSFDTARYGPPTTFDIGFALALRYFADQGVELAVLEVGLGGRYDCATAITPLASVITSISYDHMEVLGDTLAQIAGEKAGILKPGVPAVTAPQHPEAMAVIERTAREVGAPLWIAGEGEFKVQRAACSVHAMHSAELSMRHAALAPALPGLFQQENARLAVAAALLLRAGGLRLPDAAIAAGLRDVRWPGRMELVSGEPPLVLDGAHNGDSAAKLVELLRAAYPGRRLVFVVGTMRDKDLPRIMAALAPAAGALVLTRSRHPRALRDLDVLEAAARPSLAPGVPVAHTDDIGPALRVARELAGPEDLIVVTGSLAVVAAAREALGLAEGE